MVKIAIDAGHGLNTPGKRTPVGECEWSFNNKVVLAVIAKLNTFLNVHILRLDDPTGKADVPLSKRTDRANAWKADVLISIHHNAYQGKWGSHGGTETYIFSTASQQSLQIAKIVHPLVVKEMGLHDRGIKTMNLHLLRESKMPAILIEGGFMDSTVDIIAMRNESNLKRQGEAIAQGIGAYFNLKEDTPPPNVVVYKYGDTGPTIGNLQRNLNKLGYNLIVDNSFGPAVLAAVKNFQQKNKLVIDGSVNPLTQKKIVELLKEKGRIYRIIINGTQVGAYQNEVTILAEVEKALRENVNKIEIQKV